MFFSFSKPKLITILVAGIVVRELFAPFSGGSNDFELWIRLGFYVSQGLDPYRQYPAVPGLSFFTSANPNWPAYPPLWPLFLGLIYKVYILANVPNRFLYYSLIKQPMIIADVIDSFLIYKLIKPYANEKVASKAFIFWLLCPYTVFISSVWGMFDQVVLLFVLVSILLARKRLKSALSESLAITLKLVPSIYLPLFASIQSSKQKIAGYFLTVLGITSSLIFGPYLIFKSWNLQLLLNVGIDVTNKFGNTLNYWEALNNYLALVNYAAQPSIVLLIRIIGVAWIPGILVSTYYCARAVRLFQSRSRADIGFMLSLLFITLIFFLIKTVITEQFVTYFLGFGLFDYYVLGNRNRRWLFHAIWITTFVEMGINNPFFVSFFEPSCVYCTMLTGNLEFVELYGTLRLVLMAAIGVFFSILSVLYLISLYNELNLKKQSRIFGRDIYLSRVLWFPSPHPLSTSEPV